jgi:phosphoribosylamine--glycine ligase
MKVLLIGSGGREAAIAYKILQSPLLKELKVFPGNGGFSPESILLKNDIDLKSKTSVINFVLKEKFDLVVVGPEEPLVDGLADWMQEISVPCFGPSSACAKLEGSKDFAKSLMFEFGVPTASYKTFTNLEESIQYIQNHSLPIVIKADGLAAGKGVMVCDTILTAQNFLNEIFIDNKFGNSGSKVVIEEFLKGEEASVFAISDGENFIMLPALQDHKRVGEGDTGLNTGGMGAYCPAPVFTDKVKKQVEEEVFSRMFSGLKTRKTPYKGLLYAGLMIENDSAKVVEFNCRFGDPETQALLLLIEDDFLKLLYDASTFNLKQKSIQIKNGFSSVVVLASLGYPGEYIKNIPIELSSQNPNVQIFHAGTKIVDGKVLSTGGRILGIASTAKTLKESLELSYNLLNSNPIPNTFYRKDIGYKAL